MKNNECKFNGKPQWLHPVNESNAIIDEEVFFHGENDRKSIRNDSRNTYLFSNPTRRYDIAFGAGLTALSDDGDDVSLGGETNNRR